MRKTLLSLIAVFTLGSFAFTQPLQSHDDQVRTSTVVPDLHNPASGWNVVPEREKLLYQSKALTVTVKVSQEYYENVRDNMKALVGVYDANGHREELNMLYGTDNVARGAIKSGGVWYVSKELYFYHGVGNPKGTVNWEIIFDEKETDKPVKAKLTLETVDGPKEVIIDL